MVRDELVRGGGLAGARERKELTKPSLFQYHTEADSPADLGPAAGLQRNFVLILFWLVLPSLASGSNLLNTRACARKCLMRTVRQLPMKLAARNVTAS